MKAKKITKSEELFRHGTTELGMWIYLISDCLLFGSFFAAFAVLRGAGHEGLQGAELFSIGFVFVETIVLLASSYFAGIGLLELKRGRNNFALFLFVIVAILGLVFIGMELAEFNSLIVENNSWRKNAFMSSYFGLIGLHGMHIIAGLLWLSMLGLQVMRKGLSPSMQNKFAVFVMFWHFLDVIWIGIFTVVYLVGSI